MKISLLSPGAVLLFAALMTPAADAATYDVDIASFAFNPDSLFISVGDTVRWTNNDGLIPHTATSTTGVFDSGTLGNGQQYSFTFDQAGTYPYFCTIHPTMTGTVFVEEPALAADVSTLSAATGGTVTFALDAGAGFAGRTYAMTGSASGTDPGTPLPGGGVLPLNRDFVFDFIRRNFGSPLFAGFFGTLDAGGKATAVFDTMGPIPAVLPPGSTLHFAFTTISPYDFQSNAVAVDIVP